MSTPLQDAAAKLATAARRARRFPADPTYAVELRTAREHLAAVRAAHAVSERFAGAVLDVDCQRKVLLSVAGQLGRPVAA